jgi:predicted peptidase
MLHTTQHIDGEVPHRCLVYVPNGTAVPHPVLVFLHGAGEAALSRGPSPQSQPLGKIAERGSGSPADLVEQATPCLREFLVVCPQLERRRPWEAADAAWVDELLAAIVVQHNGGDRSRVYLTGFSYGGEGVFVLANALQDRWPWRALWAVDPALRQKTGERPATPAPAPEARVWIHHGRDHEPGPRSAETKQHVTVDELGEFLGRVGLGRPWNPIALGERRLTVLNKSHAETRNAAFADEHVYRWLLGA